jgi:hypothetical protein
MRRRSVVTVVIAFWASAASAQQPVEVQFGNGMVTLHARNASVRQVLDEWARVGSATIVNADGISGAQVTLDLNGVPESQALKILLRNVSGYVVAARVKSQPGASAFDRVVVLPTSAAPRPVSTASAAAPPVFGGAQQPQVAPLGFRAPQPQPGVDPGVEYPEPDILPAPVEAAPEQKPVPGTVAMPANPFGLTSGATSRPGVVVPAPSPTAPNRSPGESREQK